MEDSGPDAQRRRLLDSNSSIMVCSPYNSPNLTAILHDLSCNFENETIPQHLEGGNYSLTLNVNRVRRCPKERDCSIEIAALAETRARDEACPVLSHETCASLVTCPTLAPETTHAPPAICPTLEDKTCAPPMTCAPSTICPTLEDKTCAPPVVCPTLAPETTRAPSTICPTSEDKTCAPPVTCPTFENKTCPPLPICPILTLPTCPEREVKTTLITRTVYQPAPNCSIPDAVTCPTPQECPKLERIKSPEYPDYPECPELKCPKIQQPTCPPKKCRKCPKVKKPKKCRKCWKCPKVVKCPTPPPQRECPSIPEKIDVRPIPIRYQRYVCTDRLRKVFHEGEFIIREALIKAGMLNDFCREFSKRIYQGRVAKINNRLELRESTARRIEHSRITTIARLKSNELTFENSRREYPCVYNIVSCAKTVHRNLDFFCMGK